MATNESPPTDAPKKRRQLFKRTVQRKKLPEPGSQSPEVVGAEKSEEEANGLDFFKRSKDVFPIILQEVLEKEATPPPEKHDHKRRKDSQEPESATPPKRRKSTPAMSGGSGGRKSSFVGQDSDSDSDLIMDVKGKGKEIVKGHNLPTPRKSISAGSKISTRLMEDNKSDDDDDYFIPPVVSPAQRSQNDRTTGPRTRSSHRDSSAVEFDEDRKPSVIIEDSDGSSDLEEILPPKEDEQVDDEFNQYIIRAQQLQSIPNPDAVVTVVINSPLPGTLALAVKRKMKQTMQLVLDTWVAHQRRVANFVIPEEEASKLILTWKGNKIYGHTTPASLGVEVNEHGEVKGATGEGYKRGNLHIEAWTEEDYRMFCEQRDRDRALKHGFLDDDNENVFKAEFEEQAPSPPRKKNMKVILKAKDLESLNTTVHEDTTVGTIVGVFCKRRDIGPERKVEIWLDGEVLDENSVIGDADIDPDETTQLEVHIR